ncbi:hypothetical protein [Flavobacterium sp. ACN6]|uniref:hypothetical protein n=1 Tax=Flavobacterium sp. ACN6 TaxID=1920426 RepID=UPI000BB385F4|nr:hypothetical protein [Flavobacterium sp. ACN6]PBJ08080.1 hypothetical protein BSF42_37970 [Flavobacterium sp. ACN6]
MNRRIEYILAALCFGAVITAGFVGYHKNEALKNAGTYIAAVTVFCFFLYKLVTGWLFINLTINTEAYRTKGREGEDDHLAVKVILSKGAIDSLWLEDIEIRIRNVSEINGCKPAITEQYIKPYNFEKFELINSKTATDKYWSGSSEGLYVSSTGEETVFSAYGRISAGYAYSTEIIVVGHRPFYSLTRKKEKKIQWRASLVVLPI